MLRVSALREASAPHDGSAGEAPAPAQSEDSACYPYEARTSSAFCNYEHWVDANGTVWQMQGDPEADGAIPVAQLPKSNSL